MESPQFPSFLQQSVVHVPTIHPKTKMIMNLTCTGTECRIANRILSCSQDGQFVYEYYDPQLPHLYGIQDDTDYACGLSSNMAIYYLDLTKVSEGTSFKYIYECDTDDNYQCRIIDNSIGCYRLCGTQGENAKTWCEHQSPFIQNNPQPERVCVQFHRW